MRIYMDTANYIDLLERGQAGTTPQQFRTFLLEKKHTLVFSFPLICELITPLWDPTSDTVVTRTLNRLEEFPHEWIDLVRLWNLEVQVGLRCFRGKISYRGVDPYVGSFASISIDPPAGVKLALHYPLAEAGFDLWKSGTFDPRAQNARHVRAYRERMKRQRKLMASFGDKRQARRNLLIERIVQRIRTQRLYEAPDEGNSQLFQRAAEHIYENPEWCPSFRLDFEVFHSLVDDVGDKLEDGDLGDLAHIYALPYVDYFSTDRRIAAHTERASRTLGINYHEKIRRTVAQLVETVT